MNCAMLSLENYLMSNSSCFISIIASLEKIFVSFPSPLVLTPISPLQPKGIKGKWFSHGIWKAGWLSLWPQWLLISCLKEQLEIINWASPGLSGSIERWAKEDRQKDNTLIKIWVLLGRQRCNAALQDVCSHQLRSSAKSLARFLCNLKYLMCWNLWLCHVYYFSNSMRWVKSVKCICINRGMT